MPAVPGFGVYFYRIIKLNFPKMKNPKVLFTIKKEGNNPLYYLQTLETMTNVYTRNQLVAAFIIACNHFQVDARQIGDSLALPQWNRFFKTFD